MDLPGPEANHLEPVHTEQASRQPSPGGNKGQATMFNVPVPIVRSGAAALNKQLFTRTVPIAAAAVSNSQFITKYRQTLTKDRKLLKLNKISPVVPHPEPSLAALKQKCLLLHPDVKAECLSPSCSRAHIFPSSCSDIWKCQRLRRGVLPSNRAWNEMT